MEVGTVDKKSLLCRIGRHEWHAEKTEDGRRFKVCLRCRKIEDRASYPGSPPIL